MQTSAPRTVQLSEQALFGLTHQQLSALAQEQGEPTFRAAQLAQALYRDRIESLQQITTLPAALRARLTGAGYAVGAPRIAQTFRSVDGTERYLITAAENQTVETVWMPDGDGAEESAEEDAAEDRIAQGISRPRLRATICISSQIG